MTLEEIKKQFFAGDYSVQVEDHDNYYGIRAEYFPDLKVVQHGLSFYDCDHGNSLSYGGDLARAETIEDAWEVVKDIFEEYLNDNKDNKLYFDFED